MSPSRRRRSERDCHHWLRSDDRPEGRYLGISLINTNSMVGQEEHAYSLDHHGRRTQPNSTASGTTPAMEHTFSGRLSWEDGLGGEAIVIMVRWSRGGKMEYDADPGRVGSIDVTST